MFFYNLFSPSSWPTIQPSNNPSILVDNLSRSSFALFSGFSLIGFILILLGLCFFSFAILILRQKRKLMNDKVVPMMLMNDNTNYYTNINTKVT